MVNDVEPADRDIAMVFQNYALYPHMSAYDNMAFGPRNRGTPKAEIDRKVRAAAKQRAIADYLDRKPRALSGGQRQRVAMGRAIVREPQDFYSTNRCRTRMPSCARPCDWSSGACTVGSTQHRSSLPMTKSRQ